MPVKKARILLADDHQIIAEGLAGLLEPDYEILGIAEDGRDLVEKALAMNPDLVIADVAMPRLGGIEAVRELAEALPDARAVILSVHDEPAIVRQAFEAGASAYLLKSAAATDLHAALDEVLKGRQYVTPSLVRALMKTPPKPEEKQPTELIRVLLVDDQDVVRTGIGHFLESFGDIEIVGEASGGEEAVDLAAELSPDVILMDLLMPGMDGTEATRRILEGEPDHRVLVLTTLENPTRVLAAVRAGALGYVGKSASPTELHQAVLQVHRGDPCLPPSITALLLKAEKAPSWTLPELTEREFEIVRLVARGRTNRQIGEQLFVAEVTVRTHLRNVFEKLEVSNRVELVLYALRAGWSQLEDMACSRIPVRSPEL